MISKAARNKGYVEIAAGQSNQNPSTWKIQSLTYDEKKLVWPDDNFIYLLHIPCDHIYIDIYMLCHEGSKICFNFLLFEYLKSLFEPANQKWDEGQ